MRLFQYSKFIIINSMLIGWASMANAAISNPITANSFYDLITAIVNILLAIGIPVAVVFIIYAGFLFVTAGGSEEQLKKAKEVLIWTIAGTMLLVGAKTIASALQSTVESLGS